MARLKQMSSEHLETLLERLRDQVGTGETPPLPPGMCFEEFAAHMRQDVRDRNWADILLSIIDSSTSGFFLANMRWSLVTIAAGPHGFLTSDRSILVTNGVDQPEGEVVLPISPRQLFIAVNTREQEARLAMADPKLLRRLVNSRVSQEAQRYVYSENDLQLRFVENRLRKGQP